MNQQQKTEIGERIRALRINSAETNRSIADYVGVTVDAVKGWLAGNGISYDSAEKVAELFKVDVDWLWRGDRASTPDLMQSLGNPQTQAQLDRIEGKLDEILERLATQREQADVVSAARQTLAQGRKRDPQARDAKRQTGS